jgi:hypothetical protein
MKRKYKRLAPLLWMLLGLIFVVVGLAGTTGNRLPEWANTSLILLAAALLVVVGAISIIREIPDK